MYSLKQILIRTSLKQDFVQYSSMLNYQDLKNIFLKSVASVDPRTLIRNNVKLQENKLLVCDKQYELKNNCYVVGFGKAMLNMAGEVESILGSHLVRGVVSVPVGILSSDLYRQSPSQRIKYLEGAKHNLPDAASEQAAREISELIKNLHAEDLLIVLISGGGSALLPLPKPPVTLEEKSRLIKALSGKGADILELNCVRKRLSVLKGGGLATLAYPATVCSLVLSDIVGDPLDCIASGPTLPNRDPSDAAIKIIEKYALLAQLPGSVSRILRAGETSNQPDAVQGSFDHVTNFVIGNNKLAVSEAAEEARRLGYRTCVISVGVSGDVSLISKSYARLSLEVARLMKGASSKEALRQCLTDIQSALSISDDSIRQLINLEYDPRAAGVCIIAGGETTVTVLGRGMGGRNQQLALQFSIDVNKSLRRSRESVKNMNILLLSCGTDGIDGPTDAAGAIGFGTLCDLASEQDLSPSAYLSDNDSYNFFRKFQQGQYLIRTGHTGTNVMDVHILMIKEQEI